VAPWTKLILAAARVAADRLAAIRKTKALKAKQRKTGGR
jgi:hypothetical protein